MKERIRKARSSEYAATMHFSLQNIWPYATLLVNKIPSFPLPSHVFLGSAYCPQFYLQVLHLIETGSDDINCPTRLRILKPISFPHLPS